MADGKEIDKVKKPSISARFLSLIESNFNERSSTVIQLNEQQRRIASNYFIFCDVALKSAKEKWAKKSPQYRSDNAPEWANVDMEALAITVVSNSRLGLDPAVKNHVALTPYYNKETGKYTITALQGYRGKQLIVKKYGLDEETPDSVTVELVHASDRFIVKKKDSDNDIESYEFKVLSPFDRGEVVGGFWYHSFKSSPEKNRLMVYSKDDIVKRKPKYASAEFWGGEKDVWENGRKTNKKENIDGWFNEMCWKTLFRAAYDAITIDSFKIDDAFQAQMAIELESKVEHEQQSQGDRYTDTIEDAQIEETVECPRSEGAHIFTRVCEKCGDRKGCPAWAESDEPEQKPDAPNMGTPPPRF